MRVSRHAEVALEAMASVPSAAILHRLRKMEPPTRSTALEVASISMWRGELDPLGDKTKWPSNGDTVVVIIRRGEVKTAMLRRSWNQPFTPEAFNVEAVERWRD